MMGKEALSSAFSQMILEEAKKDKDIVVVCTDSRGSAKLGAYPDEVPDQLVEMGIAEQNSVTVSAGMAYMGKKVFTIGPASFYSMRSAEQVKVDVAYSHNNVTVIGISGGISYGALGATHHSLQDISLMRAIPGLTVMIPSDAVQMRKITKELLESPRPTYIRIARSGVPKIYEEDTEFKIGKSSYFAITAIKNENRKKAENPQVIKHELRQTINTLLDSNYYAFLDLEFSMSGPEYRGMKFHPEIIQFGLIIADAEGNLVEKFSAYVKPTLFPHVSGKTQEFLKITESAIAYGMSYQDFYDYIKEGVERDKKKYGV